MCHILFYVSSSVKSKHKGSVIADKSEEKHPFFIYEQLEERRNNSRIMNTLPDPWVITQREKLKYQDQFKALQPQNGYVTGGQAKGFFLQSQLPPLILGQIW